MSTLVARGRPIGVSANHHSLRNVHARALAPALSCHNWHDASRRTVLPYTSFATTTHRHASTKPASSQKHHLYPPLPSTIPAKATPPPTKHNRPPPSVPAGTEPSHSTTVPTLRAKELLNPPDFTYAPPIDVPAREPNQNAFKYYYSVGRAYVSFYKTSISHVRQTLKLAKSLRAKVAAASTTQRNKPSTEILSRAEWQIIRRSALDKLRLPAFGVLLLLLGEWLPVIVVYITPVIPEACRIPQQVLRNLKSIEKRRAARLEAVEMRERAARSKASSQKQSAASVDEMSALELQRLSAMLDCHVRVWDWVKVGPPTWLLRGSVKRKVEYLGMDDGLILRDGGWAALGRQEIERACVERGLPVLGQGEEQMRRALAGWKGVGVKV
ncbi:hypothetical protein T440DRAFT_467964 [Plenodomus tracheiphilus IPT5]|uniref:Letm1 RBD domain-containing protein n=1 Tax=Plenodomus tracheiphilus IPT5 TaxID=1408161 RepID=A0A6A7B7H6_9PLEO|nr:hypothetical protein T440DRAFT_467964 [Plenodomus tracheiphilus IPT5]